MLTFDATEEKLMTNASDMNEECFHRLFESKMILQLNMSVMFSYTVYHTIHHINLLIWPTDKNDTLDMILWYTSCLMLSTYAWIYMCAVVFIITISKWLINLWQSLWQMHGKKSCINKSLKRYIYCYFHTKLFRIMMDISQEHEI